MVLVRTLTRGARGEAVLDIQARLGALGYGIDPKEHGEFGPLTERAVRAFQQQRQLLVDGMVGEHTWEELVEAGYVVGDRVLYVRYPPFRGDDVRALQAGLNRLGFDAGREDGILGERTGRALREFQRNTGLPVDGIAGGTTVEALRRLRPVGPGPGRAAVREGEALRRLSASLRGARIAVDAGHGPSNPGPHGPTGLTEAEGAFLLAEALVAELTGRGANPLLLRTSDTDPSQADRARVANDVGAEVMVALHLNSHDDPQVHGACSFYYGREGWVSQPGQRLAELIQEELVARVRLRDLRTHPMALPILRETRMPAVHVEPCFVTNPREEALVRQHEFRSEVAAAVADAIERFFGRPAEEQAGTTSRDAERSAPERPAPEWSASGDSA